MFLFISQASVRALDTIAAVAMDKANVDVNKFFLFGASKVEYQIKEEFEDTKKVIRIVNRRMTDNIMAKKDKGTNNDLHNITHKHDIIACSPEAQVKYHTS